MSWSLPCSPARPCWLRSLRFRAACFKRPLASSNKGTSLKRNEPCAPLSGDAEPPSWGFLGLLGLIGGGPTFFGTVLGQAWVSEALSVGVLALAAGSILYVVGELMNVGRMFGNKTIVMSGILLGLVLGFGTDFVLVAAGA